MYNGRMTQVVTLHTRANGAEDEHGNPTQVETDTVVMGFASLQVGSEALQGAVTGARYRLFLMAGAPITGWSAATVDGVKYEIVGRPWPVFNPRTQLVHHIEADMAVASV